jgi:hypothetical protein
MELAEAYRQGFDKTKDAKIKIAYQCLQNDYLLTAAYDAQNLAETANQLAHDGSIEGTIPLEASIPPSRGPIEIAVLVRVKKCDWIEFDQQESVTSDSLRKGIDEALAEVVSGDMTKARKLLANGPTDLDGAAFAIFLSQELADSAIVFDRHHNRNFQKMKTFCNEGKKTLKTALTLLKDNPDKAKGKEVKKLQDRFNTILKNG